MSGSCSVTHGGTVVEAVQVGVMAVSVTLGFRLWVYKGGFTVLTELRS